MKEPPLSRSYLPFSALTARVLDAKLGGKPRVGSSDIPVLFTGVNLKKSATVYFPVSPPGNVGAANRGAEIFTDPSGTCITSRGEYLVVYSNRQSGYFSSETERKPRIW